MNRIKTRRMKSCQTAGQTLAQLANSCPEKPKGRIVPIASAPAASSENAGTVTGLRCKALSTSRSSYEPVGQGVLPFKSTLADWLRPFKPRKRAKNRKILRPLCAIFFISLYLSRYLKSKFPRPSKLFCEGGISEKIKYFSSLFFSHLDLCWPVRFATQNANPPTP